MPARVLSLVRLVTSIKIIIYVRSLRRKTPASKEILIATRIKTNIICWCGSTVEQLICNQQVGGSIPSTSSNNLKQISRDSRVAKGGGL